MKRQAGAEARRLMAALGDVPPRKAAYARLATFYSAKVSLLQSWLLEHGGHGEPKCHAQSQAQDDAARLLMALLDKLGSASDIDGLLSGSDDAPGYARS